MNFLRGMLTVAMGGAVGSAMRYLTSKVIQDWLPNAFPYDTLAANLLGCSAIGILYGLIDQNMPGNNNLKLLLITGFCGGFTTFSTFSHESLSLVQQGHLSYAVLHVGESVCLGMMMVLIGIKLAGQPPWYLFQQFLLCNVWMMFLRKDVLNRSFPHFFLRLSILFFTSAAIDLFIFRSKPDL